MIEKNASRLERVWSWGLHEDNIFVNRSSFFMVAHSMLFAGFAQLVAGNTPKSIYILVFCFLGIFFSAVWIYVSYVQIYITMNPLKKFLKDTDNDYLDMLEQRKKRGPSVSFVFGILCPVVIGIAWGVLLCAHYII